MTSDEEMADQPGTEDDLSRESPLSPRLDLSPVTPRTRYPVFSYPTFDEDSVRRRLRLIDTEWDVAYTERIARHEDDMRYTKLHHGLWFAVYTIIVFMATAIPFTEFSRAHSSNAPRLMLDVYALLFGIAAAFVPLWIFALFIGANLRFYNQAATVFKSSDNGSVAVSMNQVGIAARRLFVLLQESRQTWMSPPAVADRALQLTRPLLDIDFDYTSLTQQRATLKSLLYDVTAMVVIGRPDLIPRVRAGYPSLPRRSVDADGAERDILYLDPMRNRSRWEVAREYVLPLASLAVSIAAFVLASTK